MMKYTIKTKDLGNIDCQSFTLLNNKGIMYCFEETIDKNTVEYGYVADEQLKGVVLHQQEPKDIEQPAVSFESVIGQA